ncbi:hypothetical protein EII20_14140 [Comamonadaceae bacterium OH2545_COT-014]|nr:hypothetical protein EII20_14140 [Comamonadaceae bacterium OH2545_COT-014]
MDEGEVVRRIFSISLSICLLTACAWLNHERSVEVAIMKQGTSQAIVEVDKLYRGQNNLLFVIDGYNCVSSLRGRMHVHVIDESGKTILNESFLLSDLTWPRVGEGKCIPIGFLIKANGDAPLIFDLSNNFGAIKFIFDVSGFEVEGGSMMVWSAANSMLDPNKVLRSRGGSSE